MELKAQIINQTTKQVVNEYLFDLTKFTYTDTAIPHKNKVFSVIRDLAIDDPEHKVFNFYSEICDLLKDEKEIILECGIGGKIIATVSPFKATYYVQAQDDGIGVAETVKIEY